MRVSKRIVEVALLAAFVAAVVMPGPAFAKKFKGGTQIEFQDKSTSSTLADYESFLRFVAIATIAEFF